MANKCIVSNSDIAGIGTRINFYVTILLAALAPEREYTNELMDGLYKNSIVYGLGLVMSAVIQTLQEQLDLYHAIVVMQIIFSLNFVYAFSQRRFILSPIDDFSMEIFIAAQTFSTVAFTVWLLYVWIKDSNFGSQPECNHLVEYVLFFVSVRATATWLRVLFFINLISSSSVLLFTFAAIFMVYLHKGIHGTLRAIVISSHTASNAEGLEERIRRTFGKIFTVVSAVYGVVTVELIVQRNRPNIQPGENIWGFGQIIALILLFGSVIDVVVAIRRRRRRESEGIASEGVVPKSEV